MASIGTQLPSAIDALDGLTGTSAQTNSQTSATGTNSLANESTFLTLLVQQLKNQDPAQPADGTQFVTQLAQFSDLEQNLAMRTDLDGLYKKFAATNTSGTSSAGSGSVSNS